MTAATCATAVRGCFHDTFPFSPRLGDDHGVRIISFVQWPVTVFACVGNALCWQFGTLHLWCCLQDFCDLAPLTLLLEKLELSLGFCPYFWLPLLLFLVV
jgi:hypothetical protein